MREELLSGFTMGVRGDKAYGYYDYMNWRLFYIWEKSTFNKPLISDAYSFKPFVTAVK